MSGALNFKSPLDGTVFKVRTVLLGEAVWFVAKDICAVLGIRQTGRAVEPLADDEKGVNLVHTPGGPQQMVIISRSGLYRLLQRSDKPAARPFQDWLAREVVPAIEEKGAYALPAGKTIPMPQAGCWLIP